MTRAPIWVVIADTLRSELSDGRYAPGEKLPTEAQLSGRFGVNRHTVRRALSALAAEGLVWSRRGAGVFVSAPPPAEFSIGKRVRFSSQISALGRLPSRTLLALETRKAAPEEAEALGLSADALIHLYHGLSWIDQLPIALFRSAFPADRLPGLPDQLRRDNSITAALLAEGIADYTRAETRLRASQADATEARHLRLSEGASVLRAEAMNVDSQGHPIEFGRTVFAGDRVTLTVGGEA